ncbi:hypothetical protein TSOC_003260, partial [Tetrabaena socialis]
YSSKQAAEADGGAGGILADLGRYHVLPPIQPLNATWTAPFIRRSVQMTTAVAGGQHSVVGEQEGGRVRLSSPKAAAKVSEQDVYACKGFVQVIDTVLVPWAMNGYP